MKNLIPFLIIFILLGCSKNDDETLSIEEDLYPEQDLGLTVNNEYPYYPNTFRNPTRPDNRWFTTKSSDTLFVNRVDVMTDDSYDEIVYSFLIKCHNKIIPLRVVRYGNDHFAIPIRSGVIFDKPIVNFKLQNFVNNEVLACIVETPNGGYNQNFPLIDKMWIDLSH